MAANQGTAAKVVTSCAAPSPDCPDCGAGVRVIPIIWGGPAPGDAEAVAADEIELGGCVLPEGTVPHWRCRSCNKAF
jgi:hypothetical protein